MIYVNYQFADGHTEEIEVSEEVAAAFEELQKYEKKTTRKETDGIYLWICSKKRVLSCPT